MRFFLFVLATAFGLYETAYFGWNVLPGSPQELICDGITLVLTAIALATPSGWTITRISRPNNQVERQP
jgi:hypothetical protein